MYLKQCEWFIWQRKKTCSHPLYCSSGQPGPACPFITAVNNKSDLFWKLACEETGSAPPSWDHAGPWWQGLWAQGCCCFPEGLIHPLPEGGKETKGSWLLLKQAPGLLGTFEARRKAAVTHLCNEAVGWLPSLILSRGVWSHQPLRCWSC